MDKHAYIYALESLNTTLTEAKDATKTIDEISERMQSLEGFIRVLGTPSGVEDLNVGTIERIWNIARDDKMGFKDKLLTVFDTLSLVGIKDGDKKAEVLQARLEKRVAAYKKQVAELKQQIDDKTASWNYIKAGVILMLIGLVIGLGNNPEMLNSASKKLLSTANYTTKMLTGKSQRNMLARGFSYFYIRVMKFIDENQVFTMCFLSGLFLIGVGIWKRYY